MAGERSIRGREEVERRGRSKNRLFSAPARTHADTTEQTNKRPRKCKAVGDHACVLCRPRREKSQGKQREKEARQSLSHLPSPISFSTCGRARHNQIQAREKETKAAKGSATLTRFLVCCRPRYCCWLRTTQNRIEMKRQAKLKRKTCRSNICSGTRDAKRGLN